MYFFSKAKARRVALPTSWCQWTMLKWDKELHLGKSIAFPPSGRMLKWDQELHLDKRSMISPSYIIYIQLFLWSASTTDKIFTICGKHCRRGFTTHWILTANLQICPLVIFSNGTARRTQVLPGVGELDVLKRERGHASITPHHHVPILTLNRSKQ